MVETFTSYEDIRAALGVSPFELSDDTLALDTWSNWLAEDLEDASPLLLPTWEALDPDSSNLSPDELRFKKLMGLFATYAVAHRLTSSAEVFSFLKLADGRATAERVPEAFERLRENIEAMLNRVRKLLLDALAAIDPNAPTPTSFTAALVGATGIAADPVTG